MENKSCCFIGHRKIEITDKLLSRLNEEIISLLNSGVIRFLFGSKSDFNDLCYALVTQLKNDYPHIIRVAYDTLHEGSLLESERERVEAICSEITNQTTKLFGYEEVIKPALLSVTGKASYVMRNRIMIDDSDVCIIYYDESYKPAEKQNGKSINSQKSGTQIAYKYACAKEKRIINVFLSL